MSKKRNKSKKSIEKPAARKQDLSLIIAGVFMIACSVGIAVNPGLTLVTIAMFAGAGFLVAGAGNILSYFRLRKVGNASAVSLAYAALDVIVGVMLLVHPIASAVVVPSIVAACFAVFGVFEVIAAFRIRKAGASSWKWACASGIVNVMCAVMLFLVPTMLAALFAVITAVRGVGLVVFGFTAGNYE